MYVSIIVFQNSVRHGPAEVFWVSPDTGIAYVHMIVDFVYDFYAMLTYLALPVWCCVAIGVSLGNVWDG